jgi:hypothetical protein
MRARCTFRPISTTVGTAGFEPALTRFQAEDVGQATLRPVERRREFFIINVASLFGTGSALGDHQ